MTMFFGPVQLCRPDEVPIPVPVGSDCDLCGEAIVAGDIGSINFIGQVTHYECLIRSVVGSVAHQQFQCSCYGGTDEDEPGTFRDGAKAATELFRQSEVLRLERGGR